MRVAYGGAPDEPKFGDVIYLKARTGIPGVIYTTFVASPTMARTEFMFVGYSVNRMNAYVTRLNHFWDGPSPMAPLGVPASSGLWYPIERVNLTSYEWGHYREEPDDEPS